jgi:hypothetical protein
METLFVVVFIVIAVVFFYLWGRGEVVGSVEGERRGALGTSSARVTVKRVGKDAGPPTVQLHAGVFMGMRICLMSAVEANQLAGMLEQAAAAHTGESFGQVKEVEVTLIDADPGLVFHDNDDADIEIALDSDDALKVVEWLRLAASPGKTLTMARVKARQRAAKAA